MKYQKMIGQYRLTGIKNEGISDRQRDIDFFKGMGIVLVLTGHFIEPYRDFNPVFNWIFLMIYSFHMPLFCFLSGYVAKFNIKKSLKTALIYIKASVLYYLFRVIILGEVLSVKGVVRNIVYPWWHLWYLDALVIWGIALFFIDKIKNRLCVMLAALTLSLVAGYFEIPFFRSRVIVFFPFYLIGYLYKKEIRLFLNKCRLQYKMEKVIGLMLVFLIGLLVCIYNSKINAESFFNWQSYLSGAYTIQDRILYMIVAF